MSNITIKQAIDSFLLSCKVEGKSLQMRTGLLAQGLFCISFAH
jgi:hypothetical protein